MIYKDKYIKKNERKRVVFFSYLVVKGKIETSSKVGSSLENLKLLE